jgi:hypothetical protein
MTALFLRKRPDGALEPTDDLGRQVVGRISAGAVVRAEVKRPRNIGHHRKLWALVTLIYENQTRYRTPEDLLGVLKVAAGHYTTVATADGEIRVPNSVSFSAMDQTEFERFWDRVVTVVCEQIVPGMDREDLERELMGMVA